MRTQNSHSAKRRAATGSVSVPSDRRRRTRLRDLCDEVLASYRLAAERELFTEQDRSEGRALMSLFTPTRRS
jgi:hypothetical protein